MLDKLIKFSLRYKLIVILFTLTIAVFGIYAILNIPVGALPDITNNQVQVITTSSTLSTQEIEQFITAPVELEMANMPGVTDIRSISKFGLSVVTVVFRENMGTYLPRLLIAEKIKSASENIPSEFGVPEMGPITTGLGEIYQYTLDVKPGYEEQYTPMDLRTIQDWIARRQLSGIDGVVEVNSWGGYLKQYEVAVDPSRLQSLDVTLVDVFNALENNNSISGGGYIEKNAESFFIRGDGQVSSLSDIERIVVDNKHGIPVCISDIGKVRFGYANRYGAITGNGEGEKVLGQIMMLKNANSKKVIKEVKERVDEVQKSLPEGVYINPILERSELISKTTLTVFENLIIGCIIVFLVVLLLLGNLRSALVIASIIPLALCFTLSMMYIFGVDANLMSLGALDFGIIIDGAVIIVEFIVVRLSAHAMELNKLQGTERQILIDKITLSGASKMMNSAIFGQIIILVVFIPILSLQGVEGKSFRPMGLAFGFAIIGAMILCLTWLPVAISLFLKPVKNEKKYISDHIKKITLKTYMPVLKWSCNHKTIVFTISLLTLMISGIIFSRMGGEFIPTLDEGDFVIQPVLKTGTSLSKTIELTTQMENILIDKFPEVDKIVSRIGAAEVPTDPMSMEEIDMIIKLKPKKEWVTVRSKEALADKFKESLSVIPGIEYEFTQPIEMRFNELITGVRSDIAIKIFGTDLNYLDSKAKEISRLIENIPGAADIILDKTTGLPQIHVKYNRNKVAYYDVDIKTLNNYLSTAFGGGVTGSVFEGEKRFDLVVRLQNENRVGVENISNLHVPLPNGNQVPLSELAEINITEGPAKISRENTHRRVVVSVNIRNRDLQSVVNDIQKVIEENVHLESGTYIEYGGQFENLQNATKRLIFAVPIALALIFIFLHFAFKSMKDTIMIFSAVPLSVVGGILALWIRSMPFSVSAGVGFIALFGVAVLNGIVLIEHLKHLKNSGMTNMHDLIIQGASSRLRPVMLTAAAAAMGFLPMAVSTGAGAELQRPLATVVIGGLITSTMLTMIVLPLMFMLFHDDEGLRYKIVRKFKSKSFIITLLMLISSGTLSSQNSFTLDELIVIALKNNKALKSYELNVNERKELVSGLIDIDKMEVYYEYDEANLSENGKPLKTLGVDQTFEFPTVYIHKKKSGDLHASIIETEFVKQKQLLIKNVSHTYFSINLLHKKLQYFKHIDSLYQQLNNGAQTRYKLGDISQLDFLNSQAKKQQITLEVNKLESELKNECENLNSLIQSKIDFQVTYDEIRIIPVIVPDFNNLTDIKLLKQQTEYLKSSLKVAQHRLLPDISVGYFYGDNQYSIHKGYNGFHVGLGIPIFLGNYRGKIKAAKIAVESNNAMVENDLLLLQGKYNILTNKLNKYRENIEFYNNSGRELSDEIFRSAGRSYEVGEIDLYQYVISIENAVKMTIDFYQSLSDYNQTALEINYLMK